MFDDLVSYLSGYDRVVVAFSGGVDSSVLAAAAHRAQGDRALAVTANTLVLEPDELDTARRVAREIGVAHKIVEIEPAEGFLENPPDRCYHCKKNLISRLEEFEGVIVEGTNASELRGYRPGYRAIRETGTVTPYIDLGITKEEIRGMARDLGLSVADRPSGACLASRIPYGQRLTQERLQRIAGAEEYLHDMGYGQVRVRDHNGLARIEISDPREVLRDDLSDLTGHLKDLGFKWVTLDLIGYQTGSMDVDLNGENQDEGARS